MIHIYILIYTYTLSYVYLYICTLILLLSKIYTNSKEACIMRERLWTNVYSAQIIWSPILKFDWSRQVFLSNFDQTTALLECSQNWSPGSNFDHFAQSEWSLLNKSRTTAKLSQKGRSMTIFNWKTLLCTYISIILFDYVILNHVALIIIKSRVKIITWSKDGHGAHVWPLYFSSKLRPVHEVQYQYPCHIYYNISINDHPWYALCMQTWFY